MLCHLPLSLLWVWAFPSLVSFPVNSNWCDPTCSLGGLTLSAPPCQADVKRQGAVTEALWGVRIQGARPARVPSGTAWISISPRRHRAGAGPWQEASTLFLSQ